jgi:hypothetical protein
MKFSKRSRFFLESRVLCRLNILSISSRPSSRLLPYKAKAKGWLGGNYAFEPIRASHPGVARPNLPIKTQEIMRKRERRDNCQSVEKRQDVDPGFM